MAIKCPCYNCQERKEGCHASCQLYLSYKDEKNLERIHLKSHTSVISYSLSKLGASYGNYPNKFYVKKGRIY